MPSAIICDPATGHQVAYADENGKVFDIITNEFVALMQHDGNLYSPDGQLLGRLHNPDKAQAHMAPEAFIKALNSRARLRLNPEKPA